MRRGGSAAQVGVLERLCRLKPRTTPNNFERDKHLPTEMLKSRANL